MQQISKTLRIPIYLFMKNQGEAVENENTQMNINDEAVKKRSSRQRTKNHRTSLQISGFMFADIYLEISISRNVREKMTEFLRNRIEISRNVRENWLNFREMFANHQGRVGRVTRFAGSPVGGTGEPSDTTNPTLKWPHPNRGLQRRLIAKYYWNPNRGTLLIVAIRSR